jgi:hypothetical protein
MAIAIDPRLGEVKDENTRLHPMTIIDTEIVTKQMIKVAIATPAAPKRRNVEVLRPRRKSEGGVIANLPVVIILPRRDVIIAIVKLRIQRERSTNRTTILRNSSKLPVAETTAIMGVMENEKKEMSRYLRLRVKSLKNVLRSVA